MYIKKSLTDAQFDALMRRFRGQSGIVYRFLPTRAYVSFPCLPGFAEKETYFLTLNQARICFHGALITAFLSGLFRNQSLAIYTPLLLSFKEIHARVCGLRHRMQSTLLDPNVISFYKSTYQTI